MNARAVSTPYEVLLRCSIDAIVVNDDLGRVVEMSSSAEALAGVKLAAAVGCARAEVLRLEVDETAVPITLGRDDDARAFPDGTVLVKPDGTRVPVAGTSTRTVVVLRDLSERRKLLARLSMADRMASVGMLAAGVGHEISNPLSYVTANIDFALTELEGMSGFGLAESLKEALREARTGADRAGSIVKQLRTWSRAERERPQVLDLRTVLERSAKMAWTEIRHRARFTKEYRLAPHVLADETRLAQVFIILLVNAAQAIPDGRAELNEIRVVTGHDADGAAVIEVRDTGKGIAAEDLTRIFEPFFTTKREGSGLGLSIVHSIVSSLGGRVEVESTPGQGTTFRVILPAAIAEGSGETVLPPRPARPIAAPRALSRVLIVDDEPLICGAVQRALSGEYLVTAFTSARAALAHLAEGHTYHAVLLDLMMPEMNGMELFAELRLRSPEHAARVVFLTGGAFTPWATNFLRDPAVRRLEKPFDTRALVAVLGSLLS